MRRRRHHLIAACGILALGFWGLLAGCGAPPAPRSALGLSLQLRPKGSCGLSPVLYESACLAAVEVQVIDLMGRTLSKQCRAMDERMTTLADLLTAATPSVAFGSLDHLGEVRFRVTGIHDAGSLAGATDAAICAGADRTRNWLFWGESGPVDLQAVVDAGEQALRVVLPIDCRDCIGGCAALASSQCPAAMPLSYCVPYTVGLTCVRGCDDDAECFEGAVACDVDSHRCDPTRGSPVDGNTGGFCFPCETSADCDLDHACVAAPGASVGFCTQRCPDHRCVDGVMCKRVGTDLRLVDPALRTGGDGP